MIDTLKIFDELKVTLDAAAAKTIAGVIGAMYEELKNSVTKVEFNELKEVVKDLAEAQKRTELRVEELAEAQKRTELRIEEFAEAQRSLAEAQKRTEVEVRELAKALKDTRVMVGGLSDTVGYGLEDRAIRSLPALLKDKYRISVSAPLVRKFVRYDGRQDELNIFGKGRKGRKQLYLVGEAKSRLSKKHVDDLLKLATRLENNKIITADKFLFIVTYSVEPAVEEYARENGIDVIWSYEV